MRLLVLAATLLVPGTLAAQAAPTRWALEVRGPATVERGELRLNGSNGRLLMESADSAYVTLDDLAVDGTRIAFTSPAGNRRFEGTRTGDEMAGMVHEHDGRVVPWRAEVIPPGVERWPVRPRVIVRQLVIGNAATTTVIASGWRAAAASPAVILAEYDSLAKVAGMQPVTGMELLRRGTLAALGFDRNSRAIARAQLERIASSPAADAEFTRIFRGPGGLRLDLHEVAVQAARRRMPQFQLMQAGRALAMLRLVPQGTSDTLAVYEGAWRLWSRMGRDSVGVYAVVDSLAKGNALAWGSARALLAGYGDAAAWWRTAMQWLLTHDWLTRSDGRPTSPADLVAAFWGRKEIPIPVIEPMRFGGVQAVPVIGGDRLGARLVRAGNASAAEWLAQGGIGAVLDAWRTIDEGDRIVLDAGGRLSHLTAPAALARGRLGGFLSSHDAIRIEPGIVPIFAIATAVHEWQHLLFEGARLEGSSYAVKDDGRALRIVEGDPWIGEGAAEWATEATLAPIGARFPLFAFMEAEKRAGIALASDDDPHVLGYLLVRAIAEKSGDVVQVRDRLTRLLHDPVALATESGFARSQRDGPNITLPRPATLAVIPEISFIWDDGVADDIQRRLLVPATPMDR